MQRAHADCPVKKKLQKNNKVPGFKIPVLPRIFFPKSGWSTKRVHLSGGYYTGIITVRCATTKQTHSLKCYDHGQYPWGRHKSQGALSILYRQLKISTSACNVCLPLHILVALLEADLISVTNIILHHAEFVKNLLSSRHPREDVPTIMAMLRRFNLKEQVCIRRVVFLPKKGDYILITGIIGNANGQNIFLIHRCNHFFFSK